MAKQTFTTGQVLTAGQMTSLQQTAMGGGAATAKTTSYTLVAADAGTVVAMSSASPTTITVNTGLFAAGDTVHIQNLGAGVLTVTAGTATVSTSAVLTLKQYDGGTLYFVSASAAIFFSSDAADSPLTTKGDLYTYSTDNTRLAVGADNTVLIADSTQATGQRWGGGWTTWSPTVNNISLGNGTLTARYSQVGKTVTIIFAIKFGSTTVISGSPNFSMPVNGALDNQNFQAALLDNGTAWYGAFASLSGGTIYLDLAFTNATYLNTSGGAFSAVAPFTWTTNDQIVVKGTYEAA